jgi:hypothetical protein
VLIPFRIVRTLNHRSFVDQLSHGFGCGSRSHDVGTRFLTADLKRRQVGFDGRSLRPDYLLASGEDLQKPITVLYAASALPIQRGRLIKHFYALPEFGIGVKIGRERSACCFDLPLADGMEDEQRITRHVGTCHLAAEQPTPGTRPPSRGKPRSR